MKRELLIRKMIEAYAKCFGNAHNSMSAALDVAADALLGSAEPDETLKWHEEHNTPELAVVQIIAAYRLSRRVRLEAPAKKPEDRVTVEETPATDGRPAGFQVKRDGFRYFWTMEADKAKTMASGLISMLKQEEGRDHEL